MINEKYDRDKTNVETALGLSLLFLFLFLRTHVELYVQLTGLVLIAVVFIPLAFEPLTWIWVGIPKLIGPMLSKAILAVIYWAIVCPVAFIRRISQPDVLEVRNWKSVDSTYVIRDHKYTREDIVNPY